MYADSRVGSRDMDQPDFMFYACENREISALNHKRGNCDATINNWVRWSNLDGY